MDIDADPAVGASLAFAWARQSEWSQAATKAKNDLFRARYTSLGLTVFAAFLATAAVQWAAAFSIAERSLAALATLSLGLVALMQQATKPERVQSWTRTRSVAEAIKAETYTFLAGVTPYRGQDRAERFRRNLDRVLTHADDLRILTVGIKAEARPLPPVHNVASYVTERVQQQIACYYKPQSERMRCRAELFRYAASTLAVFALLLSLATAVSGHQGFAAWSPVITTVIATVAAHGAVQRYAALAQEYSRTYAELERLELNHRRPASSPAAAAAAADDFVAATEAVISIQNQSWMARNIAAAKSEYDGGPIEDGGAGIERGC